MKVFALLAILFVACQASRNSLLKSETDVLVDFHELSSYRDICKSYNPSSTTNQRVSSLKSLDIINNWEFLIEQVEECQNMIGKHFTLLFCDCATLLDLTTGTSIFPAVPIIVRKALNILAVDGYHNDNHLIIKFLIYFLAQTKVLLLQDMMTMGQNTRGFLFNEMERIFNGGFFTEAAAVKDFHFFFLKTTQAGFISRETYVTLLFSIFQNIYDSPPHKFNFLLHKLSNCFQTMVLPEELLPLYSKVMMISGLDGRDKVQLLNYLPLMVKSDPETALVTLNLHFPQIPIDSSLAEYVTKLALKDETNDDLFLRKKFHTISRKFLMLVRHDMIVEAQQYLLTIWEEMTDERASILQYILIDFLPIEETVEGQNEELHMIEFETLQHFEGDVGVIAEWAKDRDMSKILQVWFKVDKCHEFITKYGQYLFNNAHTVRVLFEMGEEMWKTLYDFSLTSSFERKLSSLFFCKEEGEEPLFLASVEIISNFYMFSFDVLVMGLIQTLMEPSSEELRHICLSRIIENFEIGNFTSLSSLYGHLHFIFKAHVKGLMGSFSYGKFLKRLMAELQFGHPFRSNYITMVVGGKPFIIDADSMENNFEWETSQLQQKFRTDFRKLTTLPMNSLTKLLQSSSTSNPNPTIGGIEMDLKFAPIFNDPLFTRILTNYIVNGRFKDWESVDTNLLLIALKIILDNFLKDILKGLPQDKALKSLEDYLTSIHDTELVNRTFDYLYYLITTKTPTVETRLIEWEDIEDEYRTNCITLLNADPAEIKYWSKKNEWNVFWNEMISITECKEFIKRNSFVLFASSPSQLYHLAISDDKVWTFFYEFDILEEVMTILTKMQNNLLNDVLITNFTRYLKYCKRALINGLLKLSNERRMEVLLSLARQFFDGIFSFNARMQDFTFFFYDAVEEGIITVASYSSLVSSILNCILHSSDIKRAYLISQFFPPSKYHEMPLPIRDNVLLEFPDFAEMFAITSWNVVHLTGINKHQIPQIHIPNLRLHPLLFDFNITRYIAHAVMDPSTFQSQDQDMIPFYSYPPHTDCLGRVIENFVGAILRNVGPNFNDIDIKLLWLQHHSDLSDDEGFLENLESLIRAFIPIA